MGATPEQEYDHNESIWLGERLSSQISELRIPYIRRNGQVNPCVYSPQFNTQVLLM